MSENDTIRICIYCFLFTNENHTCLMEKSSYVKYVVVTKITKNVFQNDNISHSLTRSTIDIHIFWTTCRDRKFKRNCVTWFDKHHAIKFYQYLNSIEIRIASWVGISFFISLYKLINYRMSCNFMLINETCGY